SVLEDVLDEKMTVAYAEKTYGVVIDPRTLRLDEERTAALRRARDNHADGETGKVHDTVLNGETRGAKPEPSAVAEQVPRSAGLSKEGRTAVRPDTDAGEVVRGCLTKRRKRTCLPSGMASSPTKWSTPGARCPPAGPSARSARWPRTRKTASTPSNGKTRRSSCSTARATSSIPGGAKPSPTPTASTSVPTTWSTSPIVTTTWR